MAFWNLAGLRAQAAVEGASGGYTAHDPNSSASGAYSFLDSTWQSQQASYNRQFGTSYNYQSAYMAPPNVQDQVASITPVSNWGGSWAGSGGANASNPLYIQSAPLDQSYFQGGGVVNAGANFTPPPGTPDTLGVSVTPGSREQTTIGPDNFSSAAGDGSEPGTTPGGIDPVTGQPDVILPDVNAGAPVTYGGAGSGGTTSGVGSGTNVNPQGVAAQSGTGNPVTVNLSPQTANDFQSYITAPIKAAEAAASSWFASAQNWFTRGFLIVIAIVILLVALWRVSGSPSPTQIVEAAAK